MQDTTIKYIATKVRQLKEDNNCSTILFLGAGASKTAGIPLASKIMEYLEKNEPYSTYISNCAKKTYAAYMNCLTNDDRKRLFNDYISKAKINTTHFYAAQLLSEGFVDCVVTTNFDPLMIKSLALFNIVPSVYDLAITKDIVTTGFQFPAIIYFHGQSHGFWQLNSDYELDLPVNAIKATINKISINRAWIIVGYSGNDPVFNQLSSIDNFGQGLYWVCNKDKDPENRIKEKLLDVPTKGTRIIKGYDSDSFFRALKNELKLNDPQIIDKPFSHLLGMVETILPVEIDDKTTDPTKEAKERLQKAIDIFEEGKTRVISDNYQAEFINEELIKLARESWLNEKRENYKILKERINETSPEEAIKYFAYLLNDWAVDIGNLAEKKEGEEAEKLYCEAIEKFKEAIKIKPDDAFAYYNWGVYLGKLAEKKEGEEAEKLYCQAIEKCKEAIRIKPDDADVYNNWGIYLGKLAEKKEPEEAEKLYREAIEKCKEAIKIKPDYADAYNNWGIALGNLAEKKEGEEAEKLYGEAFEKYREAIKIKPDYAEAYNNWGYALINLADKKEGEEAEKLYREAIEKFIEGEKIKEGACLYNLACAQARLGEKEEAVKNLIKSIEMGTALEKEEIRKDPDLKSIIDDERLKKLLE